VPYPQRDVKIVGFERLDAPRGSAVSLATDNSSMRKRP
jgi:hypothetical protein